MFILRLADTRFIKKLKNKQYKGTIEREQLFSINCLMFKMSNNKITTTTSEEIVGLCGSGTIGAKMVTTISHLSTNGASSKVDNKYHLAQCGWGVILSKDPGTTLDGFTAYPLENGATFFVLDSTHFQITNPDGFIIDDDERKKGYTTKTAMRECYEYLNNAELDNSHFIVPEDKSNNFAQKFPNEKPQFLMVDTVRDTLEYETVWINLNE